MATKSVEQASRTPESRLPTVDADVHNGFASKDALKKYLSPKWHTYHDQGLSYGTVFGGIVMGARPHRIQYSLDSLPPSGVGGSDLDLMREQLLDRHGIAKAILHPSIEYSHVPSYGDVGLAMTAAMNDWMVAEWLDRDLRLYGGISVPIEDSGRAVSEVHRATSHPRFVKVQLTALTREPMGHPKYWPIYEAAAGYHLPIAIHPGGFSGTCVATGWPPYYVESHSMSFPQAAYAQVVSLVHSGVFEHFPSLQVVLEETGMSWLAPLMARMDRLWKSSQEFMPHVKTLPSQLVREHFWVTTQPLEAHDDPKHLLQILDDLAMNERILFSSDYPHWDHDDPARVLPERFIGADLRERIFVRNAESLFRFGP